MKKQKHSTLKFFTGLDRPVFVFDRKTIDRKEKRVEPGGTTLGVSNEKDSDGLLSDPSYWNQK